MCCWDFYPDSAATNIEECEYVIHRHNESCQLRQLNMPYFNEDAIRECIQDGPNYEDKDFESQLKDDYKLDDTYIANFEVLEYWGIMDAGKAEKLVLNLMIVLMI